MPNRQTKNVSLTPSQDRFIESMVAAGRYRTASEVIRDGLRLLEQAEQRRLLEKWLYQGLNESEEQQIQPQLLERARASLDAWIDEGVRSGDGEGWIDANEAKRKLRRRLDKRLPKTGS